ncbi:probable ATP-dependent DNA helicase HFM1 isoform X2 [Neocloeon triangulifer]|uniref:probable ATP-dependent DNA helicase HFM1 isoform X2 n=1 Tax=Neocloeon triangulifer TaxID=2078957 RepID=UPI00286EFD15|nr:probable ATP-dependent DNA helicase HFM1 isoform X2 [Neocloeon triangulifer]
MASSISNMNLASDLYNEEEELEEEDLPSHGGYCDEQYPDDELFGPANISRLRHTNYSKNGEEFDDNYIFDGSSSLDLFCSSQRNETFAENPDESGYLSSEDANESFFDIEPNEIMEMPENEKILQVHTQNSFRPLVNSLCSVSMLPPRYRSVFKSIPCFNSVQSRVLDSVLNSDRPIVVAAPTGSGKTAIFELAIVRLLMQIEKKCPAWKDYKIVYMAPVKALCSERQTDWTEKFGPLGLSCTEVTGDMELKYNSALREHQIILTTPEKWDSMTRRWKDNKALVQHVKLILIDEVHLLNEDRRGPILEAVVSRMKTVQLSLELENKAQTYGVEGIRFLAVSATIPNVEDITKWLGVRSKLEPMSFSISEDQRPVKLKKVVYGYDSRPGWSPFRFDMQLNYKLKEVLIKHSDGKPSLIFCSTRKGVTQTVSVLVKEVSLTLTPRYRQEIQKAKEKLVDKKISDMLIRGIGAHHAGMHKMDRMLVENLFRNGFLPILVSTSTLAMGVNLPAHLVVIKSTEQYVGGSYTEYSEGSILQMMGRAGRPQFDTSATAVIMTKQNQKYKYERLIGGNQPIESTLHRHLAEHLNAEVVLETITNVNLAMSWLRSTFLYIRATKHPKSYNLPDDNKVETHLNNICLKEMKALSSCGIVVMNGNNVEPTDAGKIMAKYCLSLQSMKLFIENVTSGMSIEEFLQVLSKCEEFKEYQLRVVEKRTLNELNKAIRFKISGKVQSLESKVFVVIQATLGGLNHQDIALQQESMKILRVAQRVARCLDEYTRCKLADDYKSVLNSLLVAKSIEKSMWPDSSLIAKQFDGIGPKYAENLAAGGKTSFKAIRDSNPRDLERIMGIGTARGNHFITLAARLPDYNLNLKCIKINSKTVSLEVTCSLANVANLRQGKTAGARHFCLLLLADRTNNKVIYSEKITDAYLIRNTYTFATHYDIVGNEDNCEVELVANIVSESWVGIDKEDVVKIELPGRATNEKIAKPTQEEEPSSKVVKKPTKSQNTKTPAKKRLAAKTTPANGEKAAEPKKRKPSISTQTLEKFKLVPKFPIIKTLGRKPR